MRRTLSLASGVVALALLLASTSSCNDEHVDCKEYSEPSRPAHFRRRVDPDALAKNLEVSQFALKRSRESQAFEFNVPPDTAYVTCALFIGSPTVAAKPLRIENAASIIPRVRTFDTRAEQELTVVPNSLRLVTEGDDADTFHCSSPPSRYLVEGLWLGCWSSDGVAINGATELVSLDVAEVPQAQAAVSTCLEDDLSKTANRLCVPELELGVCVGDTCVAGTSDAGGSEPEQECDAMGANGHPCVLSQSKSFGRCRGGYCEAAETFPADQLVVECGSETDGFSCEQRELGAFGTCFSGRCRRRCDPKARPADPDSCTPDKAKFHGPLATEVACYQGKSFPIGVCVAPEERP